MSKDSIKEAMNAMGKAQELIRECRYYKGEEGNPYANDNAYRMVWICEKEWVDLELEGVIEKRAPYGYNNIWSMNIELPQIEGYDTPANLLRTLLCYFAYFNACTPSEICTKKIYAKLEDGRRIELPFMEAFRHFLIESYYTSSDSMTM